MKAGEGKKVGTNERRLLMAKSALIGQRRALNNSSHLTPPISSLMIFSLTYFKHEKVGLNERRCKGGDKRDFYRKIMPVILFENCSAFGKICQTEILPISQK